METCATCKMTYRKIGGSFECLRGNRVIIFDEFVLNRITCDDYDCAVLSVKTKEDK